MSFGSLISPAYGVSRALLAGNSSHGNVIQTRSANRRGQMDLRLVGWLIVIALIGFVVIYIVFELIGRAFDFAEANPLTVAVIVLIILLIVLFSLKPA
jgi:uncharacterized PurR-regulated membrane protein YhhQ (DUF165 family)